MNEPTIIQRGRVAEAVWTLGEISPGITAEVSLTVHHYGRPRYKYTAHLQPRKREQQGVFTVTSFWMFSGKSIMTGPAPRYNAKEQRAFLVKALGRIEQLLADGDETLTQMFTAPGREDAA